MKIWKDSGFWILLLVNVSLLIRYLFFALPVEAVIIGYWTQSVILGMFHAARIFLYPVDKINEPRSNDVKRKGKVFTGVFFIIHYYGFHLAYLFIIVVSFSSAHMFKGWIFTAFSFLLSGFLEFRTDIRNDRKNPRFSVNALMFIPYIRIIPMHLFMAGPKWLNWTNEMMFLVLKSIADVLFYRLITYPKIKDKKKPV